MLLIIKHMPCEKDIDPESPIISLLVNRDVPKVISSSVVSYFTCLNVTFFYRLFMCKKKTNNGTVHLLE